MHEGDYAVQITQIIVPSANRLKLIDFNLSNKDSLMDMSIHFKTEHSGIQRRYTEVAPNMAEDCLIR